MSRRVRDLESERHPAADIALPPRAELAHARQRPIDAGVAVDGVDEFLDMFIPAPGGAPLATVSASASNLVLFLRKRVSPSAPEIAVAGDAALLARFAALTNLDQRAVRGSPGEIGRACPPDVRSITAATCARAYTGGGRATMPASGRRTFLRGTLALTGLGLLAGCGGLPIPGLPSAGPRRIGSLESGSNPLGVRAVSHGAA